MLPTLVPTITATGGRITASESVPFNHEQTMLSKLYADGALAYI